MERADKDLENSWIENGNLETPFSLKMEQRTLNIQVSI